MRGLKSSGLILKGLRRGIRGDREQCSIEVLIEFSEGKVLGLGVENLEKKREKRKPSIRSFRTRPIMLPKKRVFKLN